MEFRFQPFHLETRRWLLVVGLVAVTHMLFQSLLLPYGNALRSLLPDGKEEMYDHSSLPIMQSPSKNSVFRNPLAVESLGFTNNSMLAGVENDSVDANLGTGIGSVSQSKESFNATETNFTSEKVDKRLESIVELEVDNDADEDDDGFPFENGMDRNETFAFDSDEGQEIPSVVELASETSNDLIIEQNVKQNLNISTDGIQQQESSEAHKAPIVEAQRLALPKSTSYFKTNGSSAVTSDDSRTEMTALKNGSANRAKSVRKKMRSEMPPNSVTSIDEMNHILERHRRSSRAMRPRWSSARDQEILSARFQIENSPVLKNDQDLYAPLFRNVSRFKKSYELMERILKVYIYKDGKKPIFHLPILKGLYASEGWFMKLMQGDKHFTVKDPRRAHLFYMPFSSRMLEYILYVRNSHNRTNLRQYLKEYSEKIAAKYPYWNRTGGADHFLAACHDWAPYETRHHMEHCIKALCNADVTAGFKIGRDVSLPETYVRSQRNPLRDLGGKPPSRRNILAFYAGNLHGYLRPILLKHWKDKDPDMKIFGPMPPGVASKMNYIQHMKSSKFCICPRGYEVNSPRVVEAIFYECVPVIISDNFVPPFFEVLNWESFSLILAEKDIPNLKEILLSIPHQKYLEMQLAVRKVQRHFLWHPKPLKYDLFYMTLHSIWHNRVYQIKPR